MKVTIAVLHQDGRYIARILDYLITQDGRTKDEAIAHAIQTYQELKKEYPLKKVPIDKNYYPGWEFVEKDVK